ncbi:MAG: hypothetical protein CUN55_12235 [Phototrophicales bacterium]|nr:MAG: hypothetical protein CUN55_12235 [Phototrophicales bacterium]
MAPEQILNETISPATDIYALGVILYQLLTGVVPFAGTTPVAIGNTPSQRIAYEHLHIQPPFPRNHIATIPLAVEEVILRCLAKHPLRRPASVRDVYDEFAEAIGAEPSDLTPLPPSQQGTPPDITLPEISQFVKLVEVNDPHQSNSDKTQETNGVRRIALNEEETAEAIFPPEVLEGHASTVVSGRYARVPQYLSPDEVSIMNPTPPGVVIPKVSSAQKQRSITYTRQHHCNIILMVIGFALILISFLALLAYMSGFIGDSGDDSAVVRNIPTITPIEEVPPLEQPLPETTLVNEIPLYNEGLIIYASHRTGNLDIYVTDPNATLGSRLQLTTNAALNETGPAVSPDGRQIAFYAAPINSDDHDIYIMNINGTNIQNLTNTPDEDERYVSWSPDGTQLVFHSNRRTSVDSIERDYELYLYDLQSGNIQQLTDNTVNDFGPDWSPDGTKIAYYSYDNGWHIYVMDLIEGTITQLTPDNLEARFPTWSPDGTQIAFHVTNGDMAQIYFMNADGSNIRPLMQNPGNDSFPDWSPDGSQIVFQRRNEDGVYGLYRYRIIDGLLLPIGNPLGDFFPDWTDASSS